MSVSVKKFLSYLWGKKSELSQIDEKDAMLAKLVMDIHRKRTHSSKILVNLFDLYPVHPIDRPNAMASAQERIETLTQYREQIRSEKILTNEILIKYIPSVSAIKGVRTTDDEVITFEGNGRLYALQHVFEKDDDITIEVEEYFFRNTKKITRRINRIRRIHGFI